MAKLFVLLSVLLATAPFSAQRSLVFSGRIVDESSARGVPGVLVRIVGQGEDVTDDDGIFRIALRPGTAEVQLTLPVGWAVQYPRGGRAPVPASGDVQVDIEVKRLQAENQLLRQELDRLRREGRLRDAQLDSLRRAVEDSITTFENRAARAAGLYRDSLRRTEAEAAALRAEVQKLTQELEQVFIRRNKAETYGLISTELLAYVDRLKDVRDLLPGVRDAFLHPRAAEQFNATLQRYNTARNTLHDNHESRLGSVKLYWRDEPLADDLEEVYDLALEQIHRRLVLPMNDEIIGQMQAAATGRKARVSATKKARKAADRAHAALAYPIEDLEKKIREVTLQLKN